MKSWHLLDCVIVDLRGSLQGDQPVPGFGLTEPM